MAVCTVIYDSEVHMTYSFREDMEEMMSAVDERMCLATQGNMAAEGRIRSLGKDATQAHV